ncbi:hypothetical protein OCOJLMKI_0272 [Methylobacterium iners]|uniref:Integrase n=1 Tax=Methylobacterium iners TaxID=418707 RepID=A0ABQ4RRW2_9HYPH|nr:hypothetical protein OCOJLMKI_0272 [Methylobacterium iners]
MRNLITIQLGTLFRLELDDYGLYIVIGSRDWFWNMRVRPLSWVKFVTKDRSKPGAATV